MIIINFKNYVSGEKSLELAKKVERYLPEAIVAVPTTDIFEITAETKLKVYAQHFDLVDSGKATGFVSPEDVKKAGAVGSLLNHSEHPLDFSVIKKTLARARKSRLKIVLCASNLAQAKKFIPLRPYAIAFEDKKLIGSKKSITQYRTEEVKKFAQLLRGTGIKTLCGAGIHSADDVVAARKLGCAGVLIASAIAAAPSKEAEKFLKELSKLQ